MAGGNEIKIVYKNVDEVVPYENNPRNNDEAVSAVADSIRENGFKNPIVIDRNNVIVCGHTRIKAAKNLGMTRVPCVVADDLSDEQIRKFRLQDNYTHELALWDEAKLADEVAALEAAGVDMEGMFDELLAGSEEAEAKEKPEVEFTEEVLESHNYVVLFFDNDVDWLQAQSVFNIKTVAGFSTKKDGNGKRKKRGVGRVIRGSEFLKRITEGVFNT
jgi:hypothetical protein